MKKKIEKEEVEEVEGMTTAAEALKFLKKQFGNSVVMESKDAPEKVEAIPTGCFAIDDLLGCGGLPKGRVIEVFGEPSCGKSTLCLFLAAEVQRQGGKVVYIDAENAYDASYAKSLGVKTEELILSQSETLETAFAVIRAFSSAKDVDLIIVDSVAALVPTEELEQENMFKETMALQARLMGKAMRISSGPISRGKAVVIFINQTRTKVGVFYGNPETTPGGKALKFFSSVRISVAKSEKITGKNDKDLIGNTVKLTAVKNKVGFPFKTATFDLYYGKGVDLVADTFDTAVELSVIKKTGNTYEFGDSKLGVGRDACLSSLKGDDAIYKKLHEETKKAFKNKNK